MKLPIPEEPKEIKSWMESLGASHFIGPGIEWNPLIVWYGNRLPKYLWDSWKADLKPRGFTWQKFMKLMRYRTDISVLWYKGALPWRDFVKGVIALIEGPLGTGLSEEPSASRRKSPASSSSNR
jgi:hypothetical protein